MVISTPILFTITRNDSPERMEDARPRHFIILKVVDNAHTFKKMVGMCENKTLFHNEINISFSMSIILDHSNLLFSLLGKEV